jgi:hypothetical protein
LAVSTLEERSDLHHKSDQDKSNRGKSADASAQGAAGQRGDEGEDVRLHVQSFEYENGFSKVAVGLLDDLCRDVFRQRELLLLGYRLHDLGHLRYRGIDMEKSQRVSLLSKVKRKEGHGKKEEERVQDEPRQE